MLAWRYRGYGEKVVTKQILKSRRFTRKDLLNQDSKTKDRNKLVFNFTYHLAYSKLKNILSNIKLLLTPDAQHCKVFSKVPFHLGCGSVSVIYLIVCRRCVEQYVGGCITAVSHSIFETNSSFHVKWRTTGKV